MNLNQLLLTNNDCYKASLTIIPKGIMVHSTGVNNPNLKRYVNPDDGLLGKNANNNHWNRSGLSKCVHAFIGLLADGKVATYQTLPWNWRGWHCGKSANDTHISFEICEDGLIDRVYFNKVYKEALELCVYLCDMYDFNPLANGVLICHSEGYIHGIASNHADVMHWFPKFGKSMDDFREDVAALQNKGEINITTNITNDCAEEKIWNYLLEKGLNTFGAAGMMGNLYAESGLMACNLQNIYNAKLGLTDEEYTDGVDSGSYNNFIKDRAGYGLAQWTYWSRKQALLEFAKASCKSLGDIDMQLDFLWKELQSYKTVLNILKCAGSVIEASNAVLTGYEKPADQSTSAQERRAKYGQKYFDKYAVSEISNGTIRNGDNMPIKVKVIATNLNIRKGPGTNYSKTGKYTGKGIFSITDVQSGQGSQVGWGRLKSTAGWISLDYASRV